jgi:hypothetical protein
MLKIDATFHISSMSQICLFHRVHQERTALCTIFGFSKPDFVGAMQAIVGSMGAFAGHVQLLVENESLLTRSLSSFPRYLLFNVTTRAAASGAAALLLVYGNAKCNGPCVRRHALWGR